MDRRLVLESLSAMGVGALAGCSGLIGLGSPSPQLLAVGVLNWSDESRTIRVRMRDGGTTVFQEQATLEAKAAGYDDTYYRQRDPGWGSISEYTYSIAIDGGPWQTLDPTTDDIGSETECVIVNVDIDTFGDSVTVSPVVPESCDYEFPRETTRSETRG